MEVLHDASLHFRRDGPLARRCRYLWRHGLSRSPAHPRTGCAHGSRRAISRCSAAGSRQRRKARPHRRNFRPAGVTCVDAPDVQSAFRCKHHGPAYLWCRGPVAHSGGFNGLLHSSPTCHQGRSYDRLALRIAPCSTAIQAVLLNLLWSRKNGRNHQTDGISALPALHALPPLRRRPRPRRRTPFAHRPPRRRPRALRPLAPGSRAPGPYRLWLLRKIQRNRPRATPASPSASFAKIPPSPQSPSSLWPSALGPTPRSSSCSTRSAFAPCPSKSRSNSPKSRSSAAIMASPIVFAIPVSESELCRHSIARLSQIHPSQTISRKSTSSRLSTVRNG